MTRFVFAFLLVGCAGPMPASSSPVINPQLYASIDKSGDYERRFFLVEGGSTSRQLVDGTTLAMETWFGPSPGAVYVRRWSGGRWFSGSGPTMREALAGDVAPSASCDVCHQRIATGAFTAAALERFTASRAVQRLACEASSFNPCPDEVYR
jgi:hypothetical protein